MTWTNQQYVKLTKLQATADKKSWAEFDPDVNHHVDEGYPIGFMVTGDMGPLPIPGEMFTIQCDSRNGKQASGLFRSTPLKVITFVDEYTIRIETQNSIYLITKALPRERSESGESKTGFENLPPINSDLIDGNI